VLLLPPPAAGRRATAIRLDLGANPARRLLPVRVALNVLPVTQIEILPTLKIGEGTGWPDLELMLGLEEGVTPAEPLNITSGPGTGRAWGVTADLSASGPTDAHFQFDPDRGILRFGNGVNGLTVPAGEEVRRGVLRVTRGARGNLAAGTSWSIAGDTTEFGVTRAAMAGGTDAWTREEMLDALRRQARKRAAMLTNDDMIAAVADLKGYGIARAEVIPRFAPTLPRRDMPGARTLLLRPDREVEANDAWLDAIAGQLASRRVLGERLAVTAIEPIAVAVDAKLLVAPGSDQQRIRADARQRLRERLCVAERYNDQEIDPWPAGRPVTIAELETLVGAVEGVIAVTSLLIARVGQAPACVSLPLSRLEAAVVDEPVIQFRVES
jgi:predicted phage baseplate assembly protein